MRGGKDAVDANRRTYTSVSLTIQYLSDIPCHLPQIEPEQRP